MTTEVASSPKRSFWSRNWLVLAAGGLITVLVIFLMCQCASLRYHVAGQIRISGINPVVDPNQSKELVTALTSPAALERAAQKLVRDANETEGLDATVEEMLAELMKANRQGYLSVTTASDANLVTVKMIHLHKAQAIATVNAILENTKTMEAFGSVSARDEQLRYLEKEQDVLKEKLRSNRLRRRALAEGFGTADPNQKQTALTQQIETLSEKIHQIDQQQTQADTGDLRTTEHLVHRQKYIAADPLVAALSQQIANNEAILAYLRTLDPNHISLSEGELASATALSRLLEKRQAEVGQAFDQQAAEIAEQQRQQTRQALASEKESLKKALNEVEKSLTELHSNLLKLQELDMEMTLNADMYDTVARRIKSIEVERRAQPRTTIHANASLVKTTDARWRWGLLLLLLGTAVTLIYALINDARRS